MEQPFGDKGGLGGMFENFEHSPDNGLWDRIAAGAAGEEGALGPTFEGFLHAPHGRVWSGIVNQLYPFRRRMAMLWWSAAASIALLAGAWALLPGTETLEPASLAEFQPKSQLSPTKAQVLQENGGHSQTLSKLVALLGARPDLNENEKSGGQAERQSGNGQSPKWGRKELIRKKALLAMEMKSGLQAFQARELGLETARDLSAWANPAPIELETYVEVEERDSTPDLPIYEEFNFDRESEALYALESQIGSNFSQSSMVLKSQESDLTNGIPTEPVGFNFSDDGLSSASENYSTPFSFGLGLNKRLKKRWGIGAGILYTRLESNIEYLGRDKRIDQQVRRHYLGPSLNISHEFIQGKHFSAYTTAGAQYDFGLGRHIKSRESVEGETTATSEQRLKLGGQASANLGLGMNFRLTRSLGLYMQGTAANYFYQSEGNLWSGRNLWPNFQAGLRLYL